MVSYHVVERLEQLITLKGVIKAEQNHPKQYHHHITIIIIIIIIIIMIRVIIMIITSQIVIHNHHHHHHSLLHLEKPRAKPWERVIKADWSRTAYLVLHHL